MSAEKAVREAALALQVAIGDAAKEGLVVQWPADAAGLSAIAISQTEQVRHRPVNVKGERPATFGTPQR